MGRSIAYGYSVEETGVACRATPVAYRVWVNAFVRRFANDKATAGPMPWDAFARMMDAGPRAIGRDLRTLPPAR